MKGKTAKRRSLGALIISLCCKSEAYLRQNRFAGPEIKKKRYLSYSCKIYDIMETCMNISEKKEEEKENKKQQQRAD